MRYLSTGWCSLHFILERYPSVSHSLKNFIRFYKTEEIQFLKEKPPTLRLKNILNL